MLTLFTSGSTDEPKQVTHSWNYIKECAYASIKEIELTNKDRVFNVFPSNTIAHYTITAYPAELVGAHLVTAAFNPYRYIKIFEDYSLDNCKRDAQEYLWNCPEDTKYIYLNTRIRNDNRQKII